MRASSKTESKSRETKKLYHAPDYENESNCQRRKSKTFIFVEEKNTKMKHIQKLKVHMKVCIAKYIRECEILCIIQLVQTSTTNENDHAKNWDGIWTRNIKRKTKKKIQNEEEELNNNAKKNTHKNVENNTQWRKTMQKKEAQK